MGGGEGFDTLSLKISPIFFIGCRITRFDCERLVLASKFHEEPHYNRRIFGYIRGCSGVTDGTPGNCIGDITHEPVWKAVRSAPPRINWSTMPAAEKRGGKGSRRNKEVKADVQGDSKISHRRRAYPAINLIDFFLSGRRISRE